MERLGRLLETLCARVGHAVSWLALLLVLITFTVVVLRYFFSLGWIWLQELSVYLHALLFLLGAAYTLGRNEHVRVDVFYRRMRPERRRLVDVLGVVLLLIPSMVFIAWMSWDYVAGAWINQEASRQTGGLPYPFPPLLKTAILVACVLLILQGIAWLLRGVRAPGQKDAPP